RNYSQTVRSDDPHPVELPPLGPDLLFDLAAGRPGFAKAGRENHDPHDPRFATFVNQPGNRRRRRADDSQVGRPGKVTHVRISLNPLHRLAPGIDRIDDSAEPPPNQVPQYRPADLGPFVTGPDHGNPLRLEDLVEVAGAHYFAGFGSRLASS